MQGEGEGDRSAHGGRGSFGHLPAFSVEAFFTKVSCRALLDHTDFGHLLLFLPSRS